MKRTFRYGVFETNSSSSNTFVVFDDEAVFEEWANNPDVFLDLRQARWGDCDPEDAAELDEMVYVAGAADLVARYDEVYNAEVDDMAENGLDPDEDGSFDKWLVLAHIVPHPSHFDRPWPDLGFEQGAWTLWGEKLETDGQGRPVYYIEVAN